MLFQVQGRMPLPAVGAPPVTLFSLPRGFIGYARVMSVGVGTDYCAAMWVPANAEGLAQGTGRLSAANAGLIIASSTPTGVVNGFGPYSWPAPVGGTALIAIALVNVAGATNFYIDVCGEVPEGGQDD